MKLSNELLETLRLLLNDRRDQANTKLYDAYAKCVLYQHFDSHTRYIQQCVRELDSIQNQLDEVVLLHRLCNSAATNNDDLSEQYIRFHESDE
jgi:hypothetical protein